MVDIFPEEQLVLINSVTRDHSLRYLQLPTKIDAYKYSIFPVLSEYGIAYLQILSRQKHLVYLRFI